MVLLGSWTCRGHVGDGPGGILDMQGTRRGWSWWDPGHAGDTSSTPNAPYLIQLVDGKVQHPQAPSPV